MTQKVKNKVEIPKLEGIPRRIVCFGCSLLCDDIFVEIEEDNTGEENGKLIRTVNSCFRGDKFLHSYKTENRIDSPIQKKMGLQMNLSFSEGLEILNSEIKNSNSINIYGLGAISYNQQVEVLKVIKNLVDQGKKIKIMNWNRLFQYATKFGYSLSSVGQAINSADVFLFWKTDPTHSHPKLTGKIAFTRGLFRSSGKEVKKIILIEGEESDLTNVSDISLIDKNIEPTEFIDSLSDLLENDKINNVGSGEFNELNLKNLKTYLKETEYGILITTIPMNLSNNNQIESSKRMLEIRNLLEILNDNAKGRFSIIPLSLTSNEIGQSMAIFSIFSEKEISNLIGNEENSAELSIIFGGSYLRDEYNSENVEYPENKIILFDNFQSDLSKHSLITIPYAAPGIECEDISIRFDSVNVSLKKWSEPPSEDILTIKEIFKKIQSE
ncbi:MAG: hypothetical protein GY870_02935 [archaeon]|nr:hypothetical protein [archaeon]